MKPWPRSLFYRNLLLIVALILLGQVASAVLFRQLVMKPRVQLAAQAAASHVQALRAALAVLPAEQRAAFIARLNANAPTVSDAKAGTARRLAPLEKTYIDQITQTLSAQGGEVGWRREAGHVLAVRISLDGSPYWLRVPGLVPTHALPRTWLVASAVTALLASLGAWLIQRRLDRPLRRVVDAVRSVGQGRTPPRLPETGPTEIATLARGYNEMVAGLAGHESERALMLAGLSHDLRTPLTKMRLVSELLQGQGDPALLASLDRNIEGLDHLLGQFLDFTRASVQGAGEDAVQLDVGALVREVAAQFAVPGQDIALDLGGMPPVSLPPHALRRLLSNLIANAQRHGAPPIEVATSLIAGGTCLCLEVRDRGPGIPPEQVDEVRRPFAQGNAARAGPQTGAGLGLAIVERIARSMQGSLVLLPREGGGLLARVVLQIRQGH